MRCTWENSLAKTISRILLVNAKARENARARAQTNITGLCIVCRTFKWIKFNVIFFLTFQSNPNRFEDCIAIFVVVNGIIMGRRVFFVWNFLNYVLVTGWLQSIIFSCELNRTINYLIWIFCLYFGCSNFSLISYLVFNKFIIDNRYMLGFNQIFNL